MRITLNIWDTAGQERFHALGPIYYRDSNGAVLVYDVTDPDSFNKVKTWVKELRKMLGNSVSLAIVGNKLDLLTFQEQNAPQTHQLIKEALDYTASLGNNAVHFTTSAKQNKGIDDLFLNVTNRMMELQQAQQPKNGVSNSNSNKTLRIEDDDSPGDGPREGQHRANGGCSC